MFHKQQTRFHVFSTKRIQYIYS